MEEMIFAIVNYLTSHGKVFAFVVGFCFIFSVAFVGSVMLTYPIYYRMPNRSRLIISVSVGTGIGTALVNAIFLTVVA